MKKIFIVSLISLISHSVSANITPEVLENIEAL